MKTNWKSVASNWRYVLHRWYELSESTQRSRPMEGLRGLAILLVFVCHYQLVICSRYHLAISTSFIRAITQLGGTGVDLFFLLSGMLIYKATLRENLKLRTFWARRIRRIYPTYLVSLAVYMSVLLITHSGTDRLPLEPGAELVAVISNLLLLPGLFDLSPIISAAWSLSYEFFFYAALPCFVLALRLRRWSSQRRIYLFSGLALLHICVVLAWQHSLESHRFQDRTFVRFIMFLSGIVVYEMLSLLGDFRALNKHIACFGFASFAAFLLIESNVIPAAAFQTASYQVERAVLLFIGYSGLAFLCLQRQGALSRSFSFTPLRWLGNISFSFYLIHGLILNVIAFALSHIKWLTAHSEFGLVCLFLPVFLLVFCSASLLFLYVERPLSLVNPKPEVIVPLSDAVRVRKDDLATIRLVEEG